MLAFLTECVGLLGRLIVPRTFMGLKARLFSTLVLGLVAQLAFDFEVQIPWHSQPGSVAVSMPDADLGTVVVVAAAMALLVLANVIIQIRRIGFNRELMAFARDQGVPETLRRDVIERLLHERNNRF